MRLESVFPASYELRALASVSQSLGVPTCDMGMVWPRGGV